MPDHPKIVLVCDCEGTMDAEALERAAGGRPYTQLCRKQLDAFRGGVGDGQPMVVACTQEAPLFTEAAGEVAPEVRLSFVNIRENAGWSAEGPMTGPKIAALLAEAALDLRPTPTVTLRSRGIAVIYGSGEAALDAARQLSRRMHVKLVLIDADDAAPPCQTDFAIFRGRLRAAHGVLGGFELGFDALAALAPSSRSAMEFAAGTDGRTIACDVLVDLSGERALFPAGRDGYLRADPASPAQVQRILFEAADMVGEFGKPRYVRVDATICAYSRNRKTGCTRCLDVCPSGAITPAGDHVSVDPHVCTGHGACASVCPTAAITYDMPAGDGLLQRLRTLLLAFREAGGRSPVLLVHDLRSGIEVIGLMARHGRGLPAHVLPFAVNEITCLSFDFLVSAMALGSAQVRVLAGREHRGGTVGVEQALTLAEAVAEGLGYAPGRFILDEVDDVSALEDRLYAAPPAAISDPAEFQVAGGKRAVGPLALRHLHATAPSPVDIIELPTGSPFGTVLVDDRCTVCLSCVGACPTRALSDNPDSPQLMFTESLCVQCGLCKSTCPENAVTLAPRLNFTPGAMEKRVLREDRPFHCVRCGKVFGNTSSITKMIGLLATHPMYVTGNRLKMLQMCPDCRIMAQFEDTAAPMAGRPRPVPRTTDDYLRAREARKPPDPTH